MRVRSYENNHSTLTPRSHEMKTMPRLKLFTAAFAIASLFAFSANAFAATVTSVASGPWNAPASWDTGVPGPTDDVVIGAGTAVTINTTPITINSLTVNGTLEYDAVLRAVTVTTNVSIAPGGTLQTNTVGVQTGHTLSVGGNLTNDGTLDLSTSANTSGARLTFTGAASNTFSGTGATTDLRTLTINKGTSKANILEITVSALSVQGTVVDGTPMAYLTITNGTLKISGAFVFAGRTFAAFSIPANGGFWLNNPNYTVSAVAGSATLTGLGVAGTGTPGSGALLRISAGTLNVGTAINNSVAFGNNAVVTIEGGAVNVAGRFGVSAAANNLTYTQTGGVVTVCTVGNNSAALASFDLGQGLGPDVVMSGGTVILRINNTATAVAPAPPATAPPRDYRNQQGSSALGITSTVLQFGDAGSGVAKTFQVEGLLPNVVVTNASAGHTVLFRPPSFFNNSALDVTINPGCTYNIGNNPYLQRGSTVTNNGTLTANSPSARFNWFQAGGNGTYQGAGASTGAVTSWETQLSNLTMSQAPQLVVRRAIIFVGNLLNSSKLTLGDASATLNAVQIGNTTTPTAAGNFDVAPAFDLGTGGEQISYLRTTASRTTGVEVHPGRALVNLAYDDNDVTHTLTLAGGDVTVSGTTALTNGRVITNGSTLVANGAVTRTTGYVDGFLQKPVTVGGPVARAFEVGDAVAYSPVNVTFASVTGAGTLTGTATSGDHAQIASSDLIPGKSVNRNWTLTNSGTTFTTADAVFNFVAGDLDGGANFSNFFVRKYDSPNWSALTTGTRTATSTQATGITSFSDFAVGELPMLTIVASAGTGGSISPSGSVMVMNSSDQAFTITADPCYMIADVTVDGGSVGAVSSYTFTNVTADHTIQASFSPQPVKNTETGLCYLTIQAAIDDPATVPGHHITVAAGAYVENVNDTKGVSLQGANAGACGTGPRGPESIIDGNFVGASVTLTSGSTLDGFTAVRGQNGGNAGVVMPSNTNVVSVINNIITDNTIGIYANSNGASLVDCNRIYANNLPGPSGGSGIYSDNSKDLTVSHNEFTGHTDNNPTIFGATGAGAHTGLSVVSNHYHDTYGIYCVSVSGSFTGNTISTSAVGGATSLAFSGACVGVTVNDNYFNGSPRGVRIQDDGYGYGSNENITIHHNDFTGNTEYAIGLMDGYTNPPVDAMCNWYGDISGPNAPGNPAGTGNPVVGTVTFQPWLDGSIAGTPSCGQVIQYTITASAGSGGSIDPSGNVLVASGANQVFTITPNPGNVILDVVVDGDSQGAVSSYTFTAVQANHTIHATFDIATPTLVIQLQVDPVGEALALRWELSRSVTIASVTLERANSEVGPWAKVNAEQTRDGSATVATDRSVVGGHTYWYRLVTVSTSGVQSTFGPLKATAAVVVKAFSLDMVAPNPTKGALGIDFAVAKPTRVHLSLLDVQGRVVEVFADGEYGVGRYHAQFDGQGRRGRITAGVYFVRYIADKQTFTKRVVFMQ